jgi:hypothetical protein
VYMYIYECVYNIFMLSYMYACIVVYACEDVWRDM